MPVFEACPKENPELTTISRSSINSFGVCFCTGCVAVTVNFWVTDGSYNLNTQSGGLLVYEQADPNCHPDRGGDTRLPGRETTEHVIPYRQNRFIIFKSCYLHKSHDTVWVQGFQAMRINFTLLFGDRMPPEDVRRHVAP